MTPLPRLILPFVVDTPIPAGLVSAICLVESGGDPWAWNPEPDYRYLVNAETGRPFRRLTGAERRSEKPPADFPSMPGLADDRDAEWWGQQASWGLMQVMGAVAREYGFNRHFPALCDPETNIRYGVAHLRALHQRFFDDHGFEGVIAAYNAGSPRRADGGRYVNQGYVDKVRYYWPAHAGTE